LFFHFSDNGLGIAERKEKNLGALSAFPPKKSEGLELRIISSKEDQSLMLAEILSLK